VEIIEETETSEERRRRHLADAHTHLATTLRVQGRLHEALQGYIEALQLFRETERNRDTNCAAALNNCAMVLQEVGALAEAHEAYREVRAIV
jgi:tetratricopeptide (TPR) repeat protein